MWFLLPTFWNSTFQDPASLIDIFLFTNVFSCFIEPFVLDLDVVQLYKYFPVRFWTWNNCHPISLTHFKIHDDREAPRSFAILVSERRLWVLQCWTPSNVECFFIFCLPNFVGCCVFLRFCFRSLVRYFRFQLVQLFHPLNMSTWSRKTWGWWQLAAGCGVVCPFWVTDFQEFVSPFIKSAALGISH